MLFVLFSDFFSPVQQLLQDLSEEEQKTHEKKNMKAHEWLGSPGYYFYTIIFR